MSTNPNSNVASETAVAGFAPAFFGLMAIRLSETIVEDGSRVADQLGIPVPARCMSTMITLRMGAKGVSEIARELGVSHVAVMKNVRRLNEIGLTKTGSDPRDARRKPIDLTPEGELAAQELVGFIRAIRQVYLDVFAETGIDAYDAVARFEHALNRRSFFDRLSEAVAQGPSDD